MLARAGLAIVNGVLGLLGLLLAVHLAVSVWLVAMQVLPLH